MQTARVRSKAKTSSAEEIASAVQSFFADAKEPVLIEPGDEPVSVSRENLTLEAKGHRVMLECWPTEAGRDQTVLVRRVTAVLHQKRGRLDLATERFGGKTGSLQMLDAAHPAQQHSLRRGAQTRFRETFRLMLKRQFPDWRLAELTDAPDLEHSLSPSYPRALLRKGKHAFAAIGAGEDALDPDGVLTFGLIWLDYLRQRESPLAVAGLAVFLPYGAESITCHRVLHLNPQRARCEVYVHGAGAREQRVDPADYNNLATRLDAFRQPLWSAPLDFLERVECLAELPGVVRCNKPDGSVSLRVNGLEFAAARLTPAGWNLVFGLQRKREAAPHQDRKIAKLAAELYEQRHADLASPLRRQPLYRKHPEAWLESRILDAPEIIDATLLSSPIYEQAPLFTGLNRSILDLVGIDHHGRLTVIEIKASEDIHLPLQALDYWIRVNWHLTRGEFAEAGYFPGAEIAQVPPRLLLVAPALEFHPTNATVLGFFASNLMVELVGVGIEWRRRLEVMLRQ